VYRRSDESLHWALGHVTPPTLESALQGENQENRDENLRLLYVACTRAMELLVNPDFSWWDEKSWAKQLEFGLDDIPELNVSKLRRAVVEAPKSSENRQSAEVFAEEKSRIERGFPPIAWTKRSESDPDVLPMQRPDSADDAELDAPVLIQGSRLRGRDPAKAHGGTGDR
jgi:CRISPR-associated exonuclease Cas4